MHWLPVRYRIRHIHRQSTKLDCDNYACLSWILHKLSFRSFTAHERGTLLVHGCVCSTLARNDLAPGLKLKVAELINIPHTTITIRRL